MGDIERGAPYRVKATTETFYITMSPGKSDTVSLYQPFLKKKWYRNLFKKFRKVQSTNHENVTIQKNSDIQFTTL